MWKNIFYDLLKLCASFFNKRQFDNRKFILPVKGKLLRSNFASYQILARF